MKGTSGLLFERYNTYTRRPTVQDPRLRRVIFKSFARVLGPWLPSNTDSRILDIACGEGALLSFLQDRGYGNLDGFDISPESVTLCHGLGLDFVRRFDAQHLEDWPDPHMYDVVFALDILEHIPKQDAANFLGSIRARLLPGGYTVIQTPNMGSIFGTYHRFNDLSHEYALTEKSALDLLMVAGFEARAVEIRPAWNATTTLGYLREGYLRLLHRAIYLAEDSSRPKIPTKNLLIRATRT